MTITLPSSLQEKIDAQLATGRFSRPEDVLIEALDFYTEYHATLDDVRAGIDDIAAGALRPLDEVASEVRSKHGWKS